MFLPPLTNIVCITGISVKNFASDCNCAIYVLSYLYTAIEVSRDITVCETESLPTAFTVMCTASMTPATLIFEVSGIRDVDRRTVTSISNQDIYTYSSSSNTEAALIVNDPTNAEVMNETFFSVLISVATIPSLLQPV